MITRHKSVRAAGVCLAHLVHAHTSGIPVMSEANYHHSVVFRIYRRVNLRAAVEVGEQVAHGLDLLVDWWVLVAGVSVLASREEGEVVK